MDLYGDTTKIHSYDLTTGWIYMEIQLKFIHMS